MLFLQAKVNNSSLVGIGYTQTLRPGKKKIWELKTQLNINVLDFTWTRYDSFFSGIKLILSAQVDGKNINAGGHKLGLGLELEAWGSALLFHEEKNISWFSPWVFLSGQQQIFLWNEAKTKTQAELSCTVQMESLPVASFHCGSTI